MCCVGFADLSVRMLPLQQAVAATAAAFCTACCLVRGYCIAQWCCPTSLSWARPAALRGHWVSIGLCLHSVSGSGLHFTVRVAIRGGTLPARITGSHSVLSTVAGTPLARTVRHDACIGGGRRPAALRGLGSRPAALRGLGVPFGVLYHRFVVVIACCFARPWSPACCFARPWGMGSTLDCVDTAGEGSARPAAFRGHGAFFLEPARRH